MKKYRSAIPIILIIPAGVFILAGCERSKPVEKTTASPEAAVPQETTATQEAAPPTEITVPGPTEDITVKLQIALPDGWEVNPDFGTLVYEPANRGDFFEAPRIEIVTAVEGQATPEAIPENITRVIQQIKDSSKTISTGDPALDAQGANVEIIEEKQDAGEWNLTIKLTYPEGVSDAMYPPRYWIYRFLHRTDEAFFVRIKGKVPINEADKFLTPISDACKSAVRL